MKPREARALRLAMQSAGSARRARLEETLRTGVVDSVVPELIPTEADQLAAHDALRDALKQADKAPRGRAKDRKLDKALALVPRVIYVDRVMALDPLTRAGLTPARLAVLAHVDKRAMQQWHVKVTTGVEVVLP